MYAVSYLCLCPLPLQTVQEEPSPPPQRKLQLHWRPQRPKMAPKPSLPHHRRAPCFSSLEG